MPVCLQACLHRDKHVRSDDGRDWDRHPFLRGTLALTVLAAVAEEVGVCVIAHLSHIHRVPEDQPHRTQRPTPAAPAYMASRLRRGEASPIRGRRDSGIGQSAGDGAHGAPAERPMEDLQIRAASSS